MAVQELEFLLKVRDEASEALQKLGKQAKDIESSFRSVALAGAAGFAATSAAIIKSVNDFSRFDIQIQKAGGNIRATKEELQAFREAALAVAREGVFSAEEAARALFYLAGGGIDATEAILGLKEATKIATVGEVALKDAVIAVGDVMQLFNLNTEEAAGIADIFTVSTTQVQQEMYQLIDALQRASATSKQAGLSFEETVGFLNLFADAGFRGMEGGVRLAQMLENLLTPASEEAQEEINKLTGGIFKQDGSVRNLTEVILNLRDNLKDMTDAQRAARLSTIFGVRGMQAFQIILDATDKQLEDYISELNNAKGAADDFEKRIKDAISPFALFATLIHEISIQLGQALRPAMLSIIETVRPAITALSDFIAKHPKLVANILLVTTAITGFLAFLGTLGLSLIGLVKFILALKATLGIIAVAFSALSAPVLGFIALIMAIIAAVAFLIIRWQDTKALLELIWIGIKTIAEEIWTKIKNFIIGTANFIKNSLFTVWQIIKDGVFTSFNEIQNTIQTILNAVVNFWSQTWTGIKDFLVTILGGIKNAIINAFDFVMTTLNRIINKFNEVRRIVSQPLRIVTNFVSRTIGAVRNITGLQEGGIVTRPTFATIGEAGPEAVIPLKKGGFGKTINITITGNTILASDADEVARLIGDKLIERLNLQLRLG